MTDGGPAGRRTGARARRAATFAAALCALGCNPARGQPAAERRTVEISGFAYQPGSLQVTAGDTVVWFNRDAVPHTVTAPDSAWSSGPIPAGGSWSRVSSAGDSVYFCIYHPGMIGRATVR